MNLREALSPKERIIFDVLATGQPVSVDKLAEALDPSGIHTLKAATNGIKSLAYKIAPFNFRIRMVEGGRGRGSKGVYLLERIRRN